MRPDIRTQVDDTFIFIAAISVFLLLLITVVMIYFVIKYDKKRNPKPSNITGNTMLEVIWTVIPILIVLAMFWVSWAGFENMRDVPEDAMIIKVTGQMWKWNFEYDNGKKTDTLYVPVNIPVKMEILSIDVNHSFFIPGLRVKEDAIPGRTNHLWFMGNDVRDYDIACAEYCGLNHSYMYTKLKIIPGDQFETWKNILPADTTAPADTLKLNGNPADTLKAPVQTEADTTKPGNGIDTTNR
jgi:cytochrome c oxidase subunit 2